MKLKALLATALLLSSRLAGAEHVEERVEAPTVPTPSPSALVGEVKTRRFRIAHTQAAAGAATALAADIERVRDLFAQTLGRDWPGVTEIRIGVGRAEYEAVALPGGKPPRWSVALAYPSQNIVLLDALSLNAPEGSQTLRHELSHVALGRIAPSWPRWFQEGLAMHLTGERYAVNQYATLFRAVTQDRVFHFADLTDGWPEAPADVEIAYAQSLSFVQELLLRHGSHKLGELLDAVATGESFDDAYSRVMKSSLYTDEQTWRDGLPRRYSWWPIVTTSSTVLALGALLLVIGYARRRRQYQARIAEMAAREAAEDAERRVLEAEQHQAEARFDSTAAPEPESVDSEKKPTIH